MKQTGPLSTVQYGIFVECMQHEGQMGYNIPYLYRIEGGIDAARLARAVDTAFAAHPALYTRISIDDQGTPLQSIDTDESLPPTAVTEVDDAISTARSLVRPFNLLADRLVRTYVLKQPDGVVALFIEYHHIISDGTSLQILLHEIAAAYRGSAIEPESVTLIDAATQEAKQRQSDRFEQAKQWYAEHFDCDDIYTPLLPDVEYTDRNGERISRALDISIEDIDRFCQSNNVFKSTLFTTAYAYLLARLNGQNESLTVTAYHGRNSADLHRTVGMFVQMIPVLCRFRDDTGVVELLHEQQQQASDCRHNILYSFMDIVSDLHLQFGTSFGWHGQLFADNDFAGYRLSTVEILDDRTPSDSFYLKAYLSNGHVMVQAEYDANLYSSALIEQLIDSYEAVVKGMLTTPLLADIRITTDAQISLLDRFNATESDYDATQTPVSLFQQQVQLRPDAPAVIFNDKQYTFRQVDHITDCLARHIISLGLQRQDVVSILIPRSQWMAIASLGVLKAGCAYQPLDPTYPAERLNFMMADSQAKLLIADPDLRSIVDQYTGDVLLTNDIESLPEGDTPLPQPQPHDLFCLLYTSGSTGTPKGVMVEHRNVTALLHMHRHIYHVEPDSRMCAYASYGFDAHLIEIWTPLTLGLPLFIIPEELRLDLPALNDFYQQNGITHGFMTTQVAVQFITGIENHSLRVFETGGEKLPAIAPPPYMLLNAYGPTESVCYITAYTVDRLLQNVPIGSAVDNVKLYIVDNHGHRLPAGGVGELWVSGPQVARGYLNRPEQTAAAFIPNPFCSLPDYDRCYRTGDIVRYRPDGNIEFVGRRDGQVKIRGFRIELKEVEGIIRQYPDITDATVQAFDDDGGGKFLAAYIVSPKTIDIDALNAFIADEKPPYMVPAVTMQIEAIPLTQNQKVDRRALPKPEKKIDDNDSPAAPLNLLEQELHAIIADVIGTDAFHITTPLTFVGLTSISAIKLAIQINKHYGVALNSKELVKHATLQSIENDILKSLLDADAQSVRADNNSPAPDTPDEAPLSHAQTGVYIECMKAPFTTVYNIPSMVTFPCDTDAEQVRSAVVAVAQLHPALGAHFDNTDNGIVQRYAPLNNISVPVTTMTDEALDRYKHDFVKPFNLKQGPLYRFEVVQTAKGVHLLIDVHHLVFDGASFDILLQQICDTLSGNAVEREDLGYAAFAIAEKAAEGNETYIAARNFFHSRLAGIEGSSLPDADLTNPSVQGTTGRTFAPIEFDTINNYCRKAGITAAHLTLAATFYALSRFANTDKVLLTTISNGRANLSIRNTIGMFVNTLALTADISNQPVGQFVKQVSETFEATLQHESYPFAQVAADYDIAADIMFAYQIGVISPYQYHGQALTVETLELDTPKFSIAFYVKEQDGIAGVEIEYDNGRYSNELMHQLAVSVANAAKAFVTQPDCDLTRVSLLDSNQLQQLDGFNHTDRPYDDNQTVVSLFRRQAALTPDAEAVVFHDLHFTYRQVDELSERIAAYIIGLHLGREDVVSVLIPRSQWMPIASLGVLKAGCAYQPLDPSYPRERLNFMMDDASAKLLIADPELRSIVDAYNGSVLLTTDIEHLPAPSHPVDCAPAPDDLFILLYTSGSTGTPKGCQLEHRNLVAFCNWYRRYYQLDRNSRVAAYASYGFDACMMDMYPALTGGAAVYIIGDDIRLNLPALNDYIEQQGITHAFFTTQVAYQFAINFENNSLQHLSSGGEKLASLNPPQSYRFYNGYGPTECTIFTTVYPVEQQELNVPIGKPLDNMRLYVVDKHFNRLPAGAVGELWASGPQVSRGYLNRPDKTAEVFLNNPFTDNTKYQRLYRTGDIVRYLPDGNIQFVGRKDGQVKIRGFRIELKEVEAVIRQFPDIKDVTVQAFDYDSGGKYIAAYIVADHPIDIKQLNTFISQQKPPYMVPAATMQIDAIPLNQNQKVNRRALPTPEIKLDRGDYVEPRNDIERTICRIFADILGIEKVGATDNFFELGGTSLMATRVVIDIVKAGHNVTYGDVFKYKTSAALAAFITGDNSDDKDDDDTRRSKELANFDYEPIHRLLHTDMAEALSQNGTHPIGNVLLTGATGFLGIHVLHELIGRQDVPSITCLVRGNDTAAAESRLKAMLFYYFDNSYSDLFGSRLHIALGDVTRDFRIDNDSNIQTVFNCAANVKHFSKGTDIEDVNIGGAERCIDFCLRTGAQLVHVSTYSTAGLLAADNDTDNKRIPPFDEHVLYYGQTLDNKYAWSKFVAERSVLNAVAQHGLRAKVMRVGNLAARSTDGEFQMNFQSNSFMGRLRVYQMVGALPFSQYDTQVEFSPINETAHAITLLAQTPDNCVLFHPFNHHRELLGDILELLKSLGYDITLTDDNDFSQRMDAAQANPKKAEKMSGMIAYMNMTHGKKYIDPGVDNRDTMQVLYRLGFRWNVTSTEYIQRMLHAINGLGYFDI